MRKSKKRIIILIASILIAAAAGGGGYLAYHMKQSNTQSEDVLAVMEQMIPGLAAGSDSQTSSGMGRDPLAALSIEEMDIVGCLEIPSLNLRAPVCGKEFSAQYFATWVSGSPVSGKFRLIGGREDVFLRLPKAEPGALVVFTDIDGVRYEYEVTTQYHLKDWAEADNDLMLCYEVDDQTDFVLGCTAKL